MAAVAIWLTVGANRSLSDAQVGCHREVTASRALPAGTRFTDSEKRAIGNAIIVRGEAFVPGQPALGYTCTVTRSTAGSLHVEAHIEDR